MNFTDIKLTGTNSIQVTDSLNSLLMGLKMTVTNSTVIPNDIKLNIYVEGGENKLRNYEFSLDNKLSVGDYILITPKFVNDKVNMTAFVNRNGSIEELGYQPISLYEGFNEIYTNYTNASLEVIYPKDCDTVKYFLNNALYNTNDSCNIEDFSDYFTLGTDGLDGEFNNINIKCITSANNKFSLDSEGNLFVNSVTSLNGNNNSIDFNEIYPVGSIYMNVTNVNPGTLFGGSWEQIKDRFLLASGNTYSNGSTGGEATHTLTVNEMPSHKHNTQGQWSTAGTGNRCLSYNKISGDPVRSDNPILATGGGAAHNNMPPYLAVYIWKRIS